ncbi:alpha/beta hydrolase [Amycolatopsis sp. H20-H5]|uniref:alpha/beta hydrolase n=1 Tax=Amycolatopsis sp. H20-H5 TaxID=3046309 RepID=UPI002DB99E6F|nr:alpha/beta hydrolase family protein [Amycolatopsis sp. H20-H5]MEC3978420.1 alpha/beta hydrolase family protein [Amycolatopsis sp. H20-H5]
MKRTGRMAAVVVVLAASLVSITQASAAPGVTADDGAKVVSETQIDARTVDLVISSPALGTTAPVRLLLPTGYAGQPTRTWPQLYLLHGCCEVKDYQSWDFFTDVKAMTENSDVMVVMPSDGKAGMYSAWWNWGLSSKPDWETFHTTELPQLLERGYHAGTTRSVAGLSIGGYGAMAYAFRHPGMFRAAASFSGVPNTKLFGVPEFIQGILLQQGLSFLNLWGNQYINPQLWTARNPYDHVEQLRGTTLYVSCGNGNTGPLDPAGKSDLLEPAAYAASKSFTDLLTSKGIAVTTDYYGNGTHSWEYWARELHRAWPMLAGSLGVPA